MPLEVRVGFHGLRKQSDQFDLVSKPCCVLETFNGEAYVRKHLETT